MHKNDSDIENNILVSLTSESEEELDHAVVSRGYSYDSVENAFEYLEENEKIEFSSAIKRFVESVSQDDKNDALDIIIKTIE